jgi:hypothetical protein
MKFLACTIAIPALFFSATAFTQASPKDLKITVRHTLRGGPSGQESASSTITEYHSGLAMVQRKAARMVQRVKALHHSIKPFHHRGHREAQRFGFMQP